MIVFDASAALEILLRTEASVRVLAVVVAVDLRAQVPELLDVEVAPILRRHVLRGSILASRGRSCSARRHRGSTWSERSSAWLDRHVESCTSRPEAAREEVG
jgi:predicted nucleic acid-binding protein